MKILQISAAYKPAFVYGGPTMSVAMLCESLVAAGATIRVMTTTANGKSELDAAPGIPVMVDGVPVNYFTRVTKDHSHFSPALLFALFGKVRQFDVVHIHAWWNLVSMFSCFIAILRGVPVVISPRGTLSAYSFNHRKSDLKRLFHSLIGAPILGRCHFHVTSEQEDRQIRRLINPVSVLTIPNFVKLPPVQPATGKLINGRFKILFLSRIQEKKGLDILLAALNEVKVQCELTISGDGDAAYIRYLKTIPTEAGGPVRWAGFTGDEKFALISQHDLLVLPSYDENFGNVVIESLSMGTAVLISENVGLAAYVQSNALGWVCKTDARSVSAMIDAIALTKREQLQTIRTTSPAKVRADFTGPALTEQYLKLYKSTLPNVRL